MRWSKSAPTVANTMAGRALDSIVSFFSYYLLPALIAILTIFFLAAKQNVYEAETGTPLRFSVLDGQTLAPLTPEQAAMQLRNAPSTLTHSTRLSEHPFWIAVPAQPSPVPTTIEFPSRHTQRMQCWDTTSFTSLGRADRRVAQGDLYPSKAGYALSTARIPPNSDLVCRLWLSGPARISVAAWSAPALEVSEAAFDRSIGLLEGGLLTLAVLTLMTALINRESRYLLFALWLIGNMRLGALSMGWDTLWLGRPIDPDWMPRVRMLTMAAYYLVTYTLFSQFFKAELRLIGHRTLLRVVQVIGPIILILALFMPYARYLPVLWAATGFGAAALIFFLTRILIKTRSRIALWYSAALTLVLCATFSEVIAAAFDYKALLTSLNSVSASLAASLMAAFAFAEQMRVERQERMLAQAELDRTYQVTPVGLFTLDGSGRFLRGNPALKQQLDIDNLPDAAWPDYFPESTWTRLQAIANDENGGEMEVSGSESANNAHRWFLVKATYAEGRIEGSLQDITERVKFTEKLRYLANNDPLTGVLNRRGIEEKLVAAFKACTSDTPLALAYLDLDRFKLINDLYGHQAGDEVLKQVCTRVQESLGPDHFIGRVGGDEFVIGFPDTTGNAANERCLKIVSDISTRPFQLRQRAFQVRVSIGLIEAHADLAPKDAISAADRACRQAKKGAQGHVVIYRKDAPEFDYRTEELRLIEELGSAFSPTGFYLAMQPIMSLHDPLGSLNFEILLRMRNAQGREIPAARIIAASEANGNIAELDKWVLTTTLTWLREHRARLTNTRFVCVNVSGASLNDEAFIEDIFVILEDFRDIAHMLCIEITESVALHDLENSRRFIERLRHSGAKIALDDFGAGYTSFSYLRELSADALKIDGSFVHNMHSHPANIANIEAIIELARNLGMRSIAEWTENYSTIEALAAMNVDYVQGYIVAKPQTPEALLMATSAASFVTDPDLLAFIDSRRNASLID